MAHRMGKNLSIEEAMGLGIQFLQQEKQVQHKTGPMLGLLVTHHI